MVVSLKSSIFFHQRVKILCTVAHCKPLLHLYLHDLLILYSTILYAVGMETLLRTPASSPYSECTGCRQQGHAGSKTLHQQNPPVLNWRCRLTQVDLYNGRKMVVGWLVGIFACAQELTASQLCLPQRTKNRKCDETN